ncbi:hypothetical protein [Microbacterium sp. SD291]|uniref:hypothetical protein n=1 Tax=Microbacterium sp. SD291 TaxID=2782007 RepID=UPI001A95BD27|nr:hypothetical protein [Microbacterium sp. SD291]MBO0980356.1 hypothetical protein [Microbacterium sp. SD291]
MQRAWVREIAGWSGAAAIAILVTAQVSASPRAGLLFRDGDSLVVAMFAQSLAAGHPPDWAMSSVLFLPETALFAALGALLPLDLDGLLAANAVVNVIALYGALRLAAGRRRAGLAPVAWSLGALTAFGMLAITEVSASRDALELSSLLLTTTYYSSTVIAVIAVVGLMRRTLDGSRSKPGLITAVAAVAAVATLTNPLFAAWATAPLTVLLALAMLRSGRRLPLGLMAALIAGTAIGFAGRIPFAAWIANTGAGYARPAEWTQSIVYYSGLVGDRLSTPPGVVGCILALALILVAIRQTVRARTPGPRLVAASGWMLPLLVVIGAVALGTHAARYLQPVAFAPLLALVAHPEAVRMPRRVSRALAAAAALLVLVGGGLSVPRLAAAQEPDPDLACVVDWVSDSGRTGAGQFWTVRLPKAHLEAPEQLVQVDHRLNGYAWLVDRSDFRAGEVSFLLEDAQTVRWDLPVAALPDEIVDCGRYRILDFGDVTLPLGPPHT